MRKTRAKDSDEWEKLRQKIGHKVYVPGAVERLTLNRCFIPQAHE
jgi:hypothetical protein